MYEIRIDKFGAGARIDGMNIPDSDKCIQLMDLDGVLIAEDMDEELWQVSDDTGRRLIQQARVYAGMSSPGRLTGGKYQKIRSHRMLVKAILKQNMYPTGTEVFPHKWYMDEKPCEWFKVNYEIGDKWMGLATKTLNRLVLEGKVTLEFGNKHYDKGVVVDMSWIEPDAFDNGVPVNEWISRIAEGMYLKYTRREKEVHLSSYWIRNL